MIPDTMVILEFHKAVLMPASSIVIHLGFYLRMILDTFDPVTAIVL